MQKAAVALFLLATLTATASERTDIDRFVASTLKAFPEVPGVSIAVVKDGKPFFAAGYGFADLATKRRMTANTPVYIASSTKAFTALLCEMLASEGKLDLDAPIVKYLPELDSWSDAHRITLRMLLTHSAGIRNDGIVTRTAFTGEYTPEELIRLLPSSSAIEPGFRYSNLGYVIAGYVAQRVTGEKWQDLLAKRIFAPLKMKNTTAYASRARDIATPYHLGDSGTIEPVASRKTDATMHPAGGMITTAADLEKWLLANVNEPSKEYREVHRQQVVVPEKMYVRLKRTGYTLGWYVSDYEGKPLLHALGDLEGWHAHTSFMPAPKTGVAVIANSSGLTAEPVQLIATYIYDRLNGRGDLESVYAARLAETRKTADERLHQFTAAAAQRARRAPSLTREPSSYTGRYTNTQFGTLTITNDGASLKATIGLLAAPLQPATAPDTARVQLISGIGQIVTFRIGNDGAATALEWSDATFTRVPSP